MVSITGFLFCAAIIFIAGKKLSYYGNIIAELTGLGRAWIGLILLASVTSLPELMTGISAAAIVQSADLAVGNIFGSCAFNLGILALMDAFVPKKRPIFGHAPQVPIHIATASVSIVLLALGGLGLFLPDDIVIMPGISLVSISFIAIYFFAIRMIYQIQLRNLVADTLSNEKKRIQEISLKRAVSLFAVFGIITIVASLFLPNYAEDIAHNTGLSESFFGTLFLAASTSLPEIAISFAAVRVGSIDLSIGNLLGSNLFNIFVLGISDLFYTRGHLLKEASPYHLISVLATVIMTAVAIAGLTYHSETKRFRMAWDAIIIFVTYVINLLLVYRLTG
jgi:cation:H+ antiporter